MNLVITKKGAGLTNKLIAQTAAATFTRMETSEHQYDETELQELTSIAEVRQTVPVSDVRIKNDAYVQILAAVNNSGLGTGYYVRTIGLYVLDSETGEEILYAVSTVRENPDYLPPVTKTVTGISYRFNVRVENAAQVSLYISPEAVPTPEQITDINEAARLHKESYVTTDQGVHGLRYLNEILQVNINGRWMNVSTESTIPGTTGEATVKYEDGKLYGRNAGENDWKIVEGIDGKDGISPVMSIENGVITITDVNGTKQITMSEKGEKGDKGDKGEPGEPGEQGIPGEQGTPGVSPTVSIQDNVLSVIDSTGEHSYPLIGKDGLDGTNGDGIDTVARQKIMELESIVRQMQGYTPPDPGTDQGKEIGGPTETFITAKDAEIRLQWNDPNDVVENGEVVARWAGTYIVRKEGKAPEGPEDGSIIQTVTIRNAYATFMFSDMNVSNDVKYYYGIFPFTVSKKCNTSCVLGATPKEQKPAEPYQIKVKDISGTSARITFRKGKNTSYVRLVCKKGSSPKNATDGEVIVNRFRSGDLVEDLTESTTYYCKLYAFTNSGKKVGSDLFRFSTGVTIVSFAEGSWGEIGKMLTAHYAGTIDIADYWKVGDEKTIFLDDIPSEKYIQNANDDSTSLEWDSEPQEGGHFKVVIIGIKTNTLVKSINGFTQAAVTIGLKNCLNSKGILTRYIRGYYSKTVRHQWLQKSFHNALPESLQGLIKEISLSAVVGEYSWNGLNPTVGTVVVKEFIHAACVIPTVESNSWYVGDKYPEYFKSTEDLVKKLGDNGEATDWLIRGGYSFYNGYTAMSDSCKFINASGKLEDHTTYSNQIGGDNDYCNIARGISPVFCI